MSVSPRLLVAVCVLGLGSTACGKDAPTTPAPVLVPTLLSPINNALVDNGCTDFSDPSIQDYDWTDVPNATAYHLYVFGPTALTPAVDISTITVSEYRDSDTSWVGNTVGWRWRVRAMVGGVWRDWSNDGVFNFELPDTDCPGLGVG